MENNKWYKLDDCYSKDRSIKLVINYLCKTVDLYFDSYIQSYYFNKFYYENHLHVLGWVIDCYNVRWSNELNYSNYCFALNIIREHDSKVVKGY